MARIKLPPRPLACTSGALFVFLTFMHLDSALLTSPVFPSPHSAGILLRDCSVDYSVVAAIVDVVFTAVGFSTSARSRFLSALPAPPIRTLDQQPQKPRTCLSPFMRSSWLWHLDYPNVMRTPHHDL